MFQLRSDLCAQRADVEVAGHGLDFHRAKDVAAFTDVSRHLLRLVGQAQYALVMLDSTRSVRCVA